MEFLHFVERDTAAVLVIVGAIVLLVAVIWAVLRRKKRVEAQIVPGDDRQLAQRIQSQEADIEMLKQQLAQLTNRQMRFTETHTENAQRDDVLKDFASEIY